MAELSADNTGVTCIMLVLPVISFSSASCGARHTVRPSNLAPDHPDVGTPNLTLCPVDKSNLLAQVEAIHRLAMCSFERVLRGTHLAASVLSTPSILIRLVLGLTWCFERW